MNTFRKCFVTVAAALLGTLAIGAASNAQAVDTRIGELKYENGYPTEETSRKLYDEMDFQRASQAYLWSVPAVNFASIRAGWFRDLGATYNDIILYPDFLDTKSIYLTGNNTTIYAASQIDLTDGPVVVEVPAGPTAGMFADLWFRTSGVGRLGPDKGEGGKYLLVPPGYTDELPKEGYFITPFKTMDVNYFIRGVVIKGDVAGAADMVAKSKVYPYSERANPKANKILRIVGKHISTDFPKGIEYWKTLSELINNNPVEERDRFFMAMLKPLGIEKGKPFAPDERQKRILEEGANLGHAIAKPQLRVEALGVPGLQALGERDPPHHETGKRTGIRVLLRTRRAPELSLSRHLARLRNDPAVPLQGPAVSGEFQGQGRQLARRLEKLQAPRPGQRACRGVLVGYGV